MLRRGDHFDDDFVRRIVADVAHLDVIDHRSSQNGRRRRDFVDRDLWQFGLGSRDGFVAGGAIVFDRSAQLGGTLFLVGGLRFGNLR